MSPYRTNLKQDGVVAARGKTYDILKAIAQVWLPGLGTLYLAVSQIWGLPSGEEVVATCLALTTFLGVGLGISQSNYNKTVPKEEQVGTPLAVASRHRTGGGGEDPTPHRRPR